MIQIAQEEIKDRHVIDGRMVVGGVLHAVSEQKRAIFAIGQDAVRIAGESEGGGVGGRVIAERDFVGRDDQRCGRVVKFQSSFIDGDGLVERVAEGLRAGRVVEL